MMRRNGRVVLIEVKRTENDLRDPEYREKLAQIRVAEWDDKDQCLA